MALIHELLPKSMPKRIKVEGWQWHRGAVEAKRTPPERKGERIRQVAKGQANNKISIEH